MHDHQPCRNRFKRSAKLLGSGFLRQERADTSANRFGRPFRFRLLGQDDNRKIAGNFRVFERGEQIFLRVRDSVDQNGLWLSFDKLARDGVEIGGSADDFESGICQSTLKPGTNQWRSGDNKNADHAAIRPFPASGTPSCTATRRTRE